MNRDRLRTLADAIEAEPEHFDMEMWVRWIDPEQGEVFDGSYIEDLFEADFGLCGTSACAGGMTVHLWRDECTDPDETIEDAAFRLLGAENLTEQEALAELFGCTSASAAQVVYWLRKAAGSDDPVSVFHDAASHRLPLPEAAQ